MVHEASSVAKKEEKLYIHLSNTNDMKLLLRRSNSKPRPIKVAWKIILKAICEASVLFLTQVADLIEVIPHNDVATNRAFVTTERNMDVYPKSIAYIKIATYDKAYIHLAKHQSVGEVTKIASHNSPY